MGRKQFNERICGGLIVLFLLSMIVQPAFAADSKKISAQEGKKTMRAFGFGGVVGVVAAGALIFAAGLSLPVAIAIGTVVAGTIFIATKAGLKAMDAIQAKNKTLDEALTGESANQAQNVNPVQSDNQDTAENGANNPFSADAVVKTR